MEIYNLRELKKTSNELKLFNINAFSNLSRENLDYNNIQRRLILNEFDSGERICIQYPGKESVMSNNSERVRPWDFRPKILFPDNKVMNDLSFKNIWDNLFELNCNNINLNQIAVLFLRMALMMDTILVDEKFPYEDIDLSGNIIYKGCINFKFYKYKLPTNFKFLEDLIPEINNISLYPYLMYNDLLAQNEDCKYYYKSAILNNKKWNTTTGRYNTLFTHISIIAFIEKKISFTKIMDAFQRSRGVAPLSNSDLKLLLENYISIV